MKTLVVVLGPTGVGKTELCLTLAEHLGTPIVNADSRQIFQELPIGTAAPTLEQQRRVPHYFVGNHHIEDYYSAAMYEADVMKLLQNDIFTQHDTALLTGGSMMYIDAVCKGIDDIPTVRDDIRTCMKERLEKEGLEALVEELHQLDLALGYRRSEESTKSGTRLGDLPSDRQDLHVFPHRRKETASFPHHQNRTQQRPSRTL